MSAHLTADPQCTALAANGERCKHRAMTGFDVCHYHRGESEKWRRGGLEGRWAKYLRQENLVDRYNAFYADEDLNKLRGEVALVDTLLSELVEAKQHDVSSHTWDEFLKLWAKFMQAVMAGDQVQQVRLVDQIDHFIKERATLDTNRRDILEVTEARRRLNESESKRMAQEQMYIPVERVLFMFQLVIGAAKEAAYRYADQETAKHIINGTVDAYTRLIGVSDVDATDPYSTFHGKR